MLQKKKKKKEKEKEKEKKKKLIFQKIIKMKIRLIFLMKIYFP